MNKLLRKYITESENCNSQACTAHAACTGSVTRTGLEVTTATMQRTGQFRVQIPVVPRDFPLLQNV